MTTSVRFPQPKDPADSGWYLIRFAERLTAVFVVSATPETPDDVYGLGTWRTPGDDLAPTPLDVQSWQLTMGGLAVAMFLTGGVPGGTYAIRVGVTTTAGSTLYRTAILNVTGL